MKFKQDEQGSILVSTFGLLLFISFLITTASLVIKHQVVQYNLIAHAYEAKAMIEMTNHILLEKNDELIKSGTLYFSKGIVKVKETNERTYLVEARLNNEYTSQATIVLPEPEIEEPDPIDENTYFDE